ncbi:DNA-directed RNA polymerase, mitochondrial-like [Lineus longissimus]|uniref:DNA-directed RNA polymerase, mitochondrial-like n=1 Tax=Lineus longissimus TaxID=88925 RepID=UPI00315D79EC
MRIACSICTEHYEYSSEISALHCGHTFHRHCLERWLGTASTCPQCRQRVTTSKTIHKIFLDKADEGEVTDPGELKNQVDNYRLRLGEKDQEKRDLVDRIKIREESLENVREAKTKIEAMYREEQITCKSLRKQLDYFKSQQQEAVRAKDEARTIRTYMHNLKHVETVVKGVESEVESLVKQSGEGPAAVKQLSTYCIVLKRELEMLKESKKTLKDKVDKQNKLNGTQQREIHFKSERIKQLELMLKKVQVPETPSTPMSPLCTPANTRNGGSHPRLSAPTDNGSFIEFDPNKNEELSPIPTSAKRKAECEEYGMQYIKIRSLATNCPAKKLRSEPLQDVATPQHFNILKNMRTTDTANSGKVRTGYNGLGTHTKFLKMSPPKARTIGKSLMKPKGKQASLSSFFVGHGLGCYSRKINTCRKRSFDFHDFDMSYLLKLSNISSSFILGSSSSCSRYPIDLRQLFSCRSCIANRAFQPAQHSTSTSKADIIHSSKKKWQKKQNSFKRELVHRETVQVLDVHMREMQNIQNNLQLGTHRRKAELAPSFGVDDKSRIVQNDEFLATFFKDREKTSNDVTNNVSEEDFSNSLNSFRKQFGLPAVENVPLSQEPLAEEGLVSETSFVSDRQLDLHSVIESPPPFESSMTPEAFEELEIETFTSLNPVKSLKVSSTSKAMGKAKRTKKAKRKTLEKADKTSEIKKSPSIPADSKISTIPAFSDPVLQEESQVLEPVVEDNHDKEIADRLESLLDGSHGSDVRDLLFSLQAKSKQRERMLKIDPAQMEVEGKVWAFNIELKSFVDACLYAGLHLKARSAIIFCKLSSMSKKKSYQYYKITDVSIFNMIMHGYAKLGRLDVIRSMFSHLKESGLKPTMQSFTPSLECLARQKKFRSDMAEKVIRDIEKHGFVLADVLQNCVFTGDEKDLVLKAIWKVRPNFKPYLSGSSEKYSVSLLDELNRERTPSETIEMNPYQGPVTVDELVKCLDAQLKQELSDYVEVPSIQAAVPLTEHLKDCRERLEKWKATSREALQCAFERNLRFMKQRVDGQSLLSLYPYLKVLDTSQYVDLMAHEINHLATDSENYSPSLSNLWLKLGQKVLNKYIIVDKIRNKHVKKITDLYKQYATLYTSDDMGSFKNHREMWQHLDAQMTDGPCLDIEEKQWPHSVLRGVGKFLYDIILYETKIDMGASGDGEERKLPAFYTIYRTYGAQQKQEVKPHPSLVRLFENANLRDLQFNMLEVPMVVPPVPWGSVRYGGSLLASTKIIRLPEEAIQQKELLHSMPQSQLYPVFDALNTLSSCAWIINKPVLDVVISIFNNKGDMSVDIPAPVSECPPLPTITHEMEKEERSKVIRERIRLKQQRSEMYSLWCNELYRLSIANRYRDEVFWFPHNMDFRGRVYPTPPHFNHLGSDVVRSMLLFAKGKPLGEEGLDWLKIHLVNLTGMKKRCSNAERLQYANDSMQDILDTADSPLTGKQWWRQSDEPWQTLACCMEVAQAVRSPDPTKYICHFPVHQDGSCNGLQHYAALGRDRAGAESVNLFPFEKPSDVYSDVVDMVERERLKDAADGLEIAKILEGFVARKVIKQTVMTTVYGVTRYGAKYQILRQLKYIDEFPREHAWTASVYLTDKTFYCLREMFSATKEIQDWFVMCAQLISKISNKPVQWLTPLGLPVIQPYHRTVKMNKYGAFMEDKHNMFQKPNAQKQKNGFPPNYIHSLDSTHMMLTALYCLRAGITYVSVHDCYWTHPCDVDVMNKICREQFVRLHQQPVLENLSDFMIQNYAIPESVLEKDDGKLALSMKLLNAALAKVPQRGSFDLENVLKSTYFFS